MTENPPRNSRYRGGRWVRGTGYCLGTRQQKGQDFWFCGFVVLTFLSPLLPFNVFVISQERKGRERSHLDAVGPNFTVSVGTNSHHWESLRK